MSRSDARTSVFPMLDHDLPVPLYEQLAGILRAKIANREITGKVPSVRTLSQEYGVSNKTSERALNTLRDEGLLVVVLGKGYYVARK